MTAKRALTIIAALAVYAVLWVGWSSQWSWLVTIDDVALHAAYRIGSVHAVWVSLWDLLCTVFSPGTIRILAVVLVVWMLTRREWRRALFVFVAVELSGPLTELAKYLAHRPRPITALVHESGTAFPSGHALGTMAAVLALLTLAVPLAQPAVRKWLIAAGVLIVVAVGVGRVVLNVHHPSDVLAGWALGYVWFAASTLLLPRVTPRDETLAAPDSAP